MKSAAEELNREASEPHQGSENTAHDKALDTGGEELSHESGESSVSVESAVGSERQERASLLVKGESDHTRDKEQEHGEKLKISAEDSTAASLALILTGEYALHDKLVSTPIPETDNSRADKNRAKDTAGHCWSG